MVETSGGGNFRVRAWNILVPDVPSASRPTHSRNVDPLVPRTIMSVTRCTFLLLSLGLSWVNVAHGTSINCNPTCNLDQWCDGRTGTCKQQGQDGDECTDNFGSGSGADVITGYGSSQTVLPCMYGTECFQQPDEMRCIVRGVDGDTCSSTHRPCSSNFWCDELNNSPSGVCEDVNSLASGKMCPSRNVSDALTYPTSDYCLQVSTFCNYDVSPHLCTDKKEPYGACPTGVRECAGVNFAANYGCVNGHCHPRKDIDGECSEDEWCKFYQPNLDPDVDQGANYNQRSRTCLGAYKPDGSSKNTKMEPAVNGTCQYYGTTGATCYRDLECNYGQSTQGSYEPADPDYLNSDTDNHKRLQICLGSHTSDNQYSGSSGTCQYLRLLGESCKRNEECHCAYEYSARRRTSACTASYP